MGETVGPIHVAIDPEYPFKAFWAGGVDSHTCPYADVQSIVEDSQPSYTHVPILNRPEHLTSFQGTSNREVTLVFRYLADGTPSGDRAADLAKWVTSPALWLDALKYPVQDARKIFHAPPTVRLTVGGVLTALRCVVTDVAIEWTGPWYYTEDPSQSALPMQADVQVTFVSVGVGGSGMLPISRQARSGVFAGS